MNLTKEKLKLLWKNKKDVLEDNSYLKRVKVILESLELEKIDEVPKSQHETDFFGPAKDNITAGKDEGGGRQSIEKMKEKFENKYNNQINAVCKIIGAPERERDFRVFSNASQDSDRETTNLLVGINTPDNYFISNNYFYNIAKFIKQSKNKDKFDDIVGHIKNDKVPLVAGWNDKPTEEDINKQKGILKKKFVTKYLWMLGNKEDVLTIFSLKSFYNLQQSGIFKEFEFKLSSDADFDEFTNKWREFSKKLFEELQISKNEKKLEFSKWLFILSFAVTDIKNISDLLQTGNQAVILWGPPGTGKTYESMRVAKEMLGVGENENEEQMEEKYLFSKDKDNLSRNEKGFYEIIQFHPNYTYQDFIGGITPSLGWENESNTISYKLREGIFKKFCDKAKDNKNKKFIFIIDEINRAELSAVFGELLYALEYRGKPVNIPYFKKEFTIPNNVYIIGTMNNVDKSLVTFDLALRRRFGFFKMMPKLEVIKDVLSNVVKEDSLEKYYNKCKQLNILISKSKLTEEEKNIVSSIGDYSKLMLELGEDYQIGQAYFLKIQDFLEKEKTGQIITSFELEKLWVYHIEPLLEEYLGMAMEDDSIQNKLKDIKEEFLKD